MAIKNEKIAVGTIVKLTDVGKSYSGINHPIVYEYIRRYKPCNAWEDAEGNLSISSGYNTPQRLDLRTDLLWKIAYNAPLDAYVRNYDGTCHRTGRFYRPLIYLIKSNKGHLLLINEKGFTVV